MAGAALPGCRRQAGALELGGDRGHRTFHNTASYTTADLQTGEMTTGYASLRGPLLDGVRWQARGEIQRNDARDKSQSYLQRKFELFVSSTSIST